MKKNLFSCLGLCLLSFTAPAQWISQPISFVADTAPFSFDAIDATTAWMVGTGNAGSYVTPQLARTVNAGQTWAVTNLPAQASQFEDVTTLAAHSATTAWVATATSVGGCILCTTDGARRGPRKAALPCRATSTAPRLSFGFSQLPRA